MKKIKLLIVIALCAVMTALTFGCGKGGGGAQKPWYDTEPQGQPLLTMGVISDSQILAEPSGYDINSHEHFKKALTYLKQNGAQAIVLNGDIVNEGTESAYDAYNAIMNEVFPLVGEKPEMIYSPGNHEMKSTSTMVAGFNLFKSKTGIENVNTYTKINGIPVISIATGSYTNGNSTTPDSSVKFLTDNIEDAAETANGKPIFVAHHEPIKNTVYGSEGTDASPQSNLIKAAIKQYPNVIYMSGHSHYPLLDPRSFHQELFTSVATGTMSYSAVGLPKRDTDGNTYGYNSAGNVFTNVSANGLTPHINTVTGVDTKNSNYGLVIKVYSNMTVIERIDFNSNKQIGENYKIKNATAVSDFLYTAEQNALADETPMFDDAAISAATVTRSGTTVKVRFKDAQHPIAVESYKVSLRNVGGDVDLVSACIVSDYYLNFFGEGEYEVSLRATSSTDKYNVVVTPYSCLGKEGIPFELSLS